MFLRTGSEIFWLIFLFLFFMDVVPAGVVLMITQNFFDNYIVIHYEFDL